MKDRTILILVENRRSNLPCLYLAQPLGVTPLEFGRYLWHHSLGYRMALFAWFDI